MVLQKYDLELLNVRYEQGLLTDNLVIEQIILGTNICTSVHIVKLSEYGTVPGQSMPTPQI